MSIALRAIVYLITLLWRYKPKAPRTFSALKNSNPRIRSQHCHMTIRQNCLKKITKKIRKRSSRIKGKNTLKSKKSRFWPLISTPLIFKKKKKKGITLVKLCILATIRKATLLVTAPSQKTSVGLNNLYAGDW